MHPFFNRRSYLGAYFALWLPLAGLLIFLVRMSGGFGTLEVTVILLPMSALFAMACLSTWYTCRATPLRSSGIARIFVTHAIAATLLSFAWMQVGRLYSRALSAAKAFEGLGGRYDAHTGILLVCAVLLYLVNIGFFYVLIAVETSRDAEARVLETSVLAREAELKALKAQVNPHFLFNSLNSISALTTSDPARAREMCILLAEFLRMTLGLGEKTSIPLSEELSLLHHFLAIEKVRFGARLQMTEEIQENCQSAMVPALLLQPLVENAVVHGVASSTEGGFVRLAARSENGQLFIVIENSFDPESLPTHRKGLGLENVRRRLISRYPNESTFHVSTSDGLFQVRLSLPTEMQEVAL